MTNARRHRLETLAYPDPVGFARQRNRTRALLVTAAVLGVAHLYVGALLAAAIAAPGVVGYVRQQLALGALLADVRTPALRPPLPDEDLRDVYRRVG